MNNTATLAFSKPTAIKTTGGSNVAISVGSTATLSLAAANPSAAVLADRAYNFTNNPVNSSPSGHLTTADGSTIVMTPLTANTHTADSGVTWDNTPATLQMNRATIPAGLGDILNIQLDMSQVPYTSGTTKGYVKLLSSETAADIGSHANTNFNVWTNTPGVTITQPTDVHVDANGFVYIGYTRPQGSGGGGGGGSVTYDVTIDMTTIKSADLSGGKLTVIAVSGDKASTYDLSNTKVKIVVDENDPASVTNKGNVFTITYKYPTILNGVPITVSFKDSTGAKTSFTTTAKIVNGVSVLEFPATGLPSGTYEITLSSPSGRNPFYEGKVALAYDYTAPRGLIFTMTATKTSDEKGISAYATVTSADIPQTGAKVVFTLEDSDGKAVGSTYTQTTGADGKTGTVTYPNLKNGTYTIRAAATGFNVETENVITITANANPDPDPDPTPGTGSSSSSGCDAGFGAFALLAMTGGALVLRRKD